MELCAFVIVILVALLFHQYNTSKKECFGIESIDVFTPENDQFMDHYSSDNRFTPLIRIN